MATVILIVFLLALALLGGWWLKKERVNQKNELLRQGRIAEGKFDERALQKKKPKRQKRKRPAASWFDNNYAPPEMPSKAMMDSWETRAAKAVDQALPAVQAYRLACAANKQLQDAAQAAEQHASSFYLLTNGQVVSNFGMMEEAIAAKFLTRQNANESARSLRKQFKSTRDLVLDVRSCLSQVEGWELYKAPELFHERVEIVTLIGGEIIREFDLDREPDVNDSQDNRSKRRHSWDDQPLPEPPKDEVIVGQTRIALVRALEMLPDLFGKINAALDALKYYEQVNGGISLTRPTKPVDVDIAASIAQVTDAATLLQQAQLAVYESGQEMRQKRALVDDALNVARARAQLMSSADTPDDHRTTRDAIVIALSQVSKYFDAIEPRLANVYKVQVPYDLTLKQETQAMQDAAASLRNAVRKTYFAVAQAESAKATAQASKAEPPRLAEVNAPALNQSSAQAFVNAFARMEEIQSRNKQKTAAHEERCKQLQAQAAERERLAKAAVQELKDLCAELDKRISAFPANYDISRTVATLVYRAF